MIALINKITGGEMWVHESRFEEYIKAGHKPAPLPESKPEKPTKKKPVKK